MEWPDAINLAATVLQAVILLTGAIWAYVRFFREGVHRPRIELDIECEIHPPLESQRVAAFRVITHNRGHLDFRFHDLRIRIRGIVPWKPLTTLEFDAVKTISHSGKPLQVITPFLEFPEELTESSVSLIPKKVGYFFVRPGVRQEFSYAITIPSDWEYVLAKVSFDYPTTGEIHTAERVFRVSAFDEAAKTK